MLVQGVGQAGQLGDLVVVEDALVLLVLGDLDLADAGPFLAGDDHGLLGGDRLLLELAVGVDDVVVRADLAGDDTLPQPPGGLDDDGGLAGGRVAREQDPADIGLDHALDDHAHLDAAVLEALVDPVVDGPGRVEGGPASAHVLDDAVGPLDMEEGLLLTSEAGVRQVFGRGRGPHGHVGVIVRRHLLVGLADRFLDLLGDLGVQDDLLDLLAGLGELLVVLDVKVLEHGLDLRCEVGGVDEDLESVGCDGEGRRDRQTSMGHLPQVGAFPTDAVELSSLFLLCPDDVCHGCSPFGTTPSSREARLAE